MVPTTLALPSAETRHGAPPRGRGLSPDRVVRIVAIVGIMTVAVGWRVWHLENIPGLNGDEAWSGVQALRLVHDGAMDWWTPSGNPVNWFFLLPLAAIHTLASPSIVALRSVAVASGLIALLVNYVLCRRALDVPTATISTLCLAVLPINIAYSRFAWDASQSVLATLLVLYCALIHARREGGRSISIAGALALGGAILVHPTNVFAAPLLVMPVLFGQRQRILRVLRDTAVTASTGRLAVLAAVSVAASYLAWRGLVEWGQRVRGLAGAGEFALSYLRLFSGTTVYEFIAGVGPGAWIRLGTDVACGAVVLWGLCGLLRRLAMEPRDEDAWLVASWFGMALGFMIVAGPRALAPHFERYGICLVGPGVLVLSRGLAWWIGEQCLWKRGCSVALFSAALIPLVSFHEAYFRHFEVTGGTSHRAFRTAQVEPKQAALEWILAHHQNGRPVCIVCDEWWTYWPLRYLAFQVPRATVLNGEEWRAAIASREARAGSTWFVEFADNRQSEQESSRFAGSGPGETPCHVIFDYDRQTLLRIWGPLEKISQNY